jgi:L-rhamnose mutarotase
LLLALAWDLCNCCLGVKQNISEYGVSLGTEPEELFFTICIIEARADWPAWLEIAGVRYWNHSTACCPKCMITSSKMLNASQVDLMTIDGHPDYSAFTSKEYLELISQSKVAP